MTVRTLIARLAGHEQLNFWLTNRIPRRTATRFIGWFSKIEHALVRDASMALWRLFSDLDLSDAKKTEFRSLHDCFVRELKDGARPVDPDPGVLVSPCDGIVGASGAIDGIELLQVKGFPYTLPELLEDCDLAEAYRGGSYVTLRLTACMYHRFHAPHDCRVESVTHVPGDVWNVNPVALRRVDKLFCRNERAIIRTRLATGHVLTLVPVAAILVAGIRLSFLDPEISLRGKRETIRPPDVNLRKGDEMGWFEHGSTIIVFAPPGLRLCAGIAEGETIRMGQPLLSLPQR